MCTIARRLYNPFSRGERPHMHFLSPFCFRLDLPSLPSSPFIPLIRSDVLLGFVSIRVVPSANSKGTRPEGPEASISRLLSSGIPSPVDAKSQRDLEIMKSCLDREEHSGCRGREFSTRSGRNPGGDHNKVARRESGSRPGDCWLTWEASEDNGEEAQVPSRLRVRTRGFAPDLGKGSLHLALRDPHGPGSEANRAGRSCLGMALLDRVHDVGHLVTIMGNQASLLEAEIDMLKTKGDPEQLAVARQQAEELQAGNAKLKLKLDKLSHRSEQADKELSELSEGLAESQRHIKE
ncbi:hypothetical protein BHE74_00017187 [Ensete ventricosum]|nr:hypothetical protein BHE74_00017187 [Ensete ventricosum]RZR80853.1 hypothetical protein BHM03_00006956 [Ensete ventricosum]